MIILIIMILTIIIIMIIVIPSFKIVSWTIFSHVLYAVLQVSHRGAWGIPNRICLLNKSYL